MFGFLKNVGGIGKKDEIFIIRYGFVNDLGL